ncbi:hypothetical protein KOR42_55600 [Thalassoglobus neptunius]|uniref:Uncharacterized protein n=1 Tax=Thalassoglobus neptunius TaxID=1938619 RepID=A0A5C5UUE8_9PLAN|nr:hypothetical protein KOR42_55600 [Thalassoglobus neptunius]
MGSTPRIQVNNGLAPIQRVLDWDVAQEIVPVSVF